MQIPCPQRLLGKPCSGTFSLSSVRRFRELQKANIDCHTCAQSQEVTKLLTGFELVVESRDEQLERIVRHLKEAGVDRRRVAEITAETASHVRTAIKMLSTEIDDCPRLFVVEQVATRKRMPWNDRFSLVLCCEHQGHEHPWEPATYRFTRPKSWYREVLPYAIFASRILKIAMPVAGSLAHATTTGPTAQWLDRQFKVVRSVAEQVPDKSPNHPHIDTPSNRLDPAQGAALRTYRFLLLSLDPGRDFGGLRQVWTAAGDVLWVCPDHHREHEPGLPHVPKG
jgi:internalin A